VRVLMSWGEGCEMSRSPLSRVEIRALFEFLRAELRGSDVYREALGRLGLRALGSVGLHFCGDEEMRALQLRYRRLDRTTDVLSFPILEAPGAREMLARLPAGERSWGDLVVSLATVERGARRGRRPVREELSEVLIHGFLHLLGMDHVVGRGVTVRDARAMKALQRKLFHAWVKARGA